MTITVHLEQMAYTATVPLAGAPHAHVAAVGCPFCKAPAPLAVHAKHSTKGHDTVRGQGFTGCCDHAIGEIVVKLDTIFGLEEDEAMLVHGRPRVY